MPSIAIMNAKGGVGKSTLTMALAETLAVFHGKNILLIDADGQMSLSLMLMPVERLNAIRDSGATIVGFLRGALSGAHMVDWRTCVTGNISDVDGARNLYIIGGDMDLPLLEREISTHGKTSTLRHACRDLLAEAEQYVDLVLVDCAPGISVVTECWLRECAWNLVPVKPDVLALGGLQYLNRFKQRNPELGFARHLGVVINMKQQQSETDQMVHEHISSTKGLGCFQAEVPMIPHIQKAALFLEDGRSYQNKYPAEAGRALRALAGEILDRIGQAR